MRTVGKILFVLSILVLFWSIRSSWRDHGYRKASTAVKARIVHAGITKIRYPKAGAATHDITRTIVFMRDGAPDTLNEKYSARFFPLNTAPTVQDLLKATPFVRYVPQSRRSETAFPDRIDLNATGTYESGYTFSLLTPFVLALIGFFLLRFGASK